jgi:hypothetical protein
MHAQADLLWDLAIRVSHWELGRARLVFLVSAAMACSSLPASCLCPPPFPLAGSSGWVFRPSPSGEREKEPGIMNFDFHCHDLPANFPDLVCDIA